MLACIDSHYEEMRAHICQARATAETIGALIRPCQCGAKQACSGLSQCSVAHPARALRIAYLCGQPAAAFMEHLPKRLFIVPFTCKAILLAGIEMMGKVITIP